MSNQEIRVVGHLGGDPVMRETKGGKQYATFSLGVSDDYKPKNSEDWIKSTIWFRVSVWGPKGGLVADRLHKGQKVKVTGKLSHDDQGNPRVWEDKDGKTRSSFEIFAFNVQDPEENPDELPARQVEDDPF